MAGIYIHIPFCKQACHYCDFHFSTSLKKKDELVAALCQELVLRQGEVAEKVETVYFGGGTPSLLSKEDVNRLMAVIESQYELTADPEITLEANPDDLSEDKIQELADTAVNRLSIGIQSFFERDLRWMNRSHNAQEALSAIQAAKQHFTNLSIDLIYGVPGLSDEEWHQNLEQALALEIPHISSYALTVEPQTALHKMINKGKKQAVDDAAAKRHYHDLVSTLTAAGYINYEFSNFGKPGFFSKNNTGYWFGKPYLGIGPSAHGFDGTRRSWNVANNTKYIKAITAGELPHKQETLSIIDRYNEYIMTRFRTIWGVSPAEIRSDFGTRYVDYFLREAKPLLADGLLENKAERYHITSKGKFLGDRISADLFYV